MTCFGSAIAATIRLKIRYLPMKRFFARAYPAIAAVMQVRIIAITAMNTVLTIQRMAAGTVGPVTDPNWNSGALRLEKSTWKFRIVNSLGHHCGLGELMAAGGFSAPVMIQYSGKMKRNARMIRTTTEKIL